MRTPGARPSLRVCTGPLPRARPGPASTPGTCSPRPARRAASIPDPRAAQPPLLPPAPAPPRRSRLAEAANPPLPLVRRSLWALPRPRPLSKFA